MKYLIKTNVDVKHTKEIAKEVTAMFKLYDYKVQFTVEDIDLDTSQEFLYDIENSWSFFSLTMTKSIKRAVVYAFHKPSYDGTCLFIDKNKGLQTPDLRGQHNLQGNVGLIEIYSNPIYIKKTTNRNGDTYYNDSRRKTKLRHDTHVLFHEIIHDIEDRQGKKGLHDAERADKLDSYVKELLPKKKDNSIVNLNGFGLLPLVERKLKRVFLVMALLGTPMAISEGYRSFERQEALYKQKPKVTNAKGGESLHQYGVAVDCYFIKHGYDAPDILWKRYGILAKYFGFTHGGDWRTFKDFPHIEMTLDYSLKDFQQDKVDYKLYN